MDKKYFTAFCVMDSTHLRANIAHHGFLLFLEASCTSGGELTEPPRVVDAFGFYSHPVPECPAPLKSPMTFFAYQTNVPRLTGSYGEWRRENIHDLCLGRGLTGRLFDMSQSQFENIVLRMHGIVEFQQQFFAGKKTLKEREAFYEERLQVLTGKYIADGHPLATAEKMALKEMPIKKFNMPFSGERYTCKLAALDMLIESYDVITTALRAHFSALRGEGISGAFPRLTYGLDEIVIHAQTDTWQTRGKHSKYPYCDWQHIDNSDGQVALYVVSFGNKYIQSNGAQRMLYPLPTYTINTIQDLKLLSRICEINMNDAEMKGWQHEIGTIIHKIACASTRQIEGLTTTANSLLLRLIKEEKFQANVPSNLYSSFNSLTARIEDMLNQLNYDGIRQLAV